MIGVDLLQTQDLGARVNATVEFGKQFYGDEPAAGEEGDSLRRNAYRAAEAVLPHTLAAAFRGTHAGYYGGLNPLVVVIGWSRGPSKRAGQMAWRDPSSRFSLGCPWPGTNDYVKAMRTLSARILKHLAEELPELRGVSPADLRAAGHASVLFANATPAELPPGRQAPDTDSSGRARLLHILELASPLLIVVNGRMPPLLRFVSEIFPSRDVTCPPGNFVSSHGKTSGPRRFGSLEINKRPTAFMELPFHPSFLGRYQVFQESVVEIGARLVSNCLVQRRLMKSGDLRPIAPANQVKNPS